MDIPFFGRKKNETLAPSLDHVLKPTAPGQSTEAGPSSNEQPGERPAAGHTPDHRVSPASIPAISLPTLPSSAVAPRSPMQQQVENVLSAGMDDIYRSMSSDQQTQFRITGEQTAQILERLILSVQATSQKVVELIRRWLQLIPGVNIFFLEQTSKIKTDQILALQREQHQRRSPHP